MAVEEILDHILIPRPNGSEGFAEVASFLSGALEQSGASVTWHEFTATPHGFQIVWGVSLILVLGYCAAIAARRHGAALVLMLAIPVLLLLEFEFLRSPISGLLPLRESNIVGSFSGEPGGPTLVLCAHYDTATHFGDHSSWGAWGLRQGPATAIAVLLAAAGLWRRRRGRDLPRALALSVAALTAVPFAAMFWFQTIGPVVRDPSSGAIDNGGSVAALLLLAEQLGERSPGAPTNVKIVFPAAEEERALGSWAYAQTLDRRDAVAIINLEFVGAARDLAYAAEDGFALKRYRSSDRIIELVNDTARGLWGAPLRARELPFGTFTDGRSFLAHGVPALTLRAFTGDSVPRRLHSAHDSRDRLTAAGIERSAEFLRALVDRVDRDPSLLDGRRDVASDDLSNDSSGG
jgi:acetylornithine deacetylase/succinyl-diaminopimelate desuccinylase-like protein